MPCNHTLGFRFQNGHGGLGKTWRSVLSAIALIVCLIPHAPGALGAVDPNDTDDSARLRNESVSMERDELSLPEPDKLEGGGPLPDLIVGNVFECTQLGRVGPVGSGKIGVGCATTACNKGDVIIDIRELPDPRHPVISLNMFRLRTVAGSQRFEQIGQSWVKHTFGSSNFDECGFGCTVPPLGVAQIGIGCSDTYVGFQFEPCALGSKTLIHPYRVFFPFGPATGTFCDGFFFNVPDFPARNHSTHVHTPISHELQIQDVDLMPSLNAGAKFFIEGTYLDPTEYAYLSGNQNNNGSYKELRVQQPDGGGTFIFNELPALPIHPEELAINAWPGSAQSLIEPAPMEDGQAVLTYEVTDLGGGQWHYEYSIYNRNLDLAVGALRIDTLPGVTLSNVEFYMPPPHDPEPDIDNYSTAPWSFSQSSQAVEWATDTFDMDPLANAVRWGTMYNFRFDADAPPSSTKAHVRLFKSGEEMCLHTLGPSPALAFDCDGNGNFDGCEVEAGLVPDCNANGAPDSCDIDSLFSVDCNANAVPDDCDLAAATSEDCNATNVPDECEPLAAPAFAAPLGSKNRFISVSADNPGESTAIRVTLRSLQHPDPQNSPCCPPNNYSSHEGAIRWAGPPGEFPESTSPGSGTFPGARLQCTPHFMDWSTVGPIHVTGEGIIPSSILDVDVVRESCMLGNPTGLSSAITFVTSRWGDVAEPYSPPSGTTQPDFQDISAVVDKFKSLPTAAMKIVAQLQPNEPNMSADVDFLDISACVDAFKGLAYPFGEWTGCSP